LEKGCRILHRLPQQPNIQLRHWVIRHVCGGIAASAVSAAIGQSPTNTAADGSKDRPNQTATRSSDRARRSTGESVRRTGITPRDLLKLIKRKLFHF
jgi:hypothetical protein